MVSSRQKPDGVWVVCTGVVPVSLTGGRTLAPGDGPADLPELTELRVLDDEKGA